MSQFGVIYNNAGFSPGGRKKTILIGTLIAIYLQPGQLLKQGRPEVFWSVFFLCTSESIKLLYRIFTSNNQEIIFCHIRLRQEFRCGYGLRVQR